VSSVSTITVESVQASDNTKTDTEIAASLERRSIPGGSQTEGYFLKLHSPAASVGDISIEDVLVEITPYVDAGINGTVAKTLSVQNSGVVSSYYTYLSSATYLAVKVDAACDYTPAVGDIVAIASDHNGTKPDYAKVSAVDSTPAGVGDYELTLDAAFAQDYARGAPLVFNPVPLKAIGYDRWNEGMKVQLSKPGPITAIWNAGDQELDVTAITDDVVLHSGCVVVFVSDAEWTPEKIAKIDGLFPDKIVAGSNFSSDYSIGSFSTMNGGEAIGSGGVTRYFLPLAVANLTAAQCAVSSAGLGMFTAILGGLPTSSISGTIT